LQCHENTNQLIRDTLKSYFENWKNEINFNFENWIKLWESKVNFKIVEQWPHTCKHLHIEKFNFEHRDIL
jgi:hypothetical protein